MQVTHPGGLIADAKADITQHEIAALKTRYNLADAHTHQRQSPTQRAIVESLPSIWYEAENHSQYASEQAFIEAFYRFHGQQHALKRSDNIYLVYAASIGMHITATYLQKTKARVGLIEPCFDNLPDLMKHMQVSLSPLPEHLFKAAEGVYANLAVWTKDLDAIFMVDPNNPTGFSLFNPGPEAFKEVVRFCVDHDKLLILDLCFAAFLMTSGQPRCDIYEILENSGVRYIAMEDTGKTWPLQDAKCATLLASQNINDDIYPIVTSVLLNVSPFVLRLITRYIEDSGKDNFASVRNLLDVNRECARDHLDSPYLKYCEPQIKSSVAWFEIQDPKQRADELQAYLLEDEIYVLSGKYFYWNNPEQGQRYIRIALAREAGLFSDAMKAIKKSLGGYFE
ncbi:aminotransferase class I/II-fold pyridoxal phosphate-dependent enzyme [uncultured Aquabacterium sp.]|uniref:aminotransferase class I/II-fold pyridoxal phosphate-dependent enzyme n=1 Tax=uncultured Aquabacterium sp. TaxID=158753 RepID=UPI0030CAC325